MSKELDDKRKEFAQEFAKFSPRRRRAILELLTALVDLSEDQQTPGQRQYFRAAQLGGRLTKYDKN